MTEFISTQSSSEKSQSTRSGVTAACTLPAIYYEDVKDALSEIHWQGGAATPYDMLWALNKTGLLNSFLQEINSPEALLLGLEELHKYLGSNQPYHEGIEQRLEAANFLRHIAESHQLEKHAGKVIQQEEPFTQQQLEQTLATANTLFCQTMLNITNESTTAEVLKCARQFFPTMDKNKVLFSSSLIRRFQENNVNLEALPCYQNKELNVLLCKEYLDHWATKLSNQRDLGNEDKLNVASVKSLLQKLEASLQSSPGM